MSKPARSAPSPESARPAKSSKAGCAICGRPTDPAFRPFCSKRCADIDLQRWLSGRYVVPAVENEQGPPQEGADED